MYIYIYQIPILELWEKCIFSKIFNRDKIKTVVRIKSLNHKIEAKNTELSKE